MQKTTLQFRYCFVSVLCLISLFSVSLRLLLKSGLYDMLCECVFFPNITNVLHHIPVPVFNLLSSVKPPSPPTS